MLPLITLLSCGLKVNSTSQKPIRTTENDVNQNIDLYLSTLMNKNLMQGSFVLMRQEKVLFQNAYGSIDAKGIYKANTQTLYRIASVSKTYTATMIFQLIDEGKLTLEQTIDKWFPTIRNANKITVSHLLRHRSGLYPLLLEEYNVLMYEPISFEEMIEKKEFREDLFYRLFHFFCT